MPKPKDKIKVEEFRDVANALSLARFNLEHFARTATDPELLKRIAIAAKMISESERMNFECYCKVLDGVLRRKIMSIKLI